jgi:toxin ParE1/3/4
MGCAVKRANASNRRGKPTIVRVEVTWTSEAREDLLRVYVLIGLEQPAAAERYYDRIEAKARLLADQPRMGVRRPEIRRDVRILIETPYVILYRTEPDTDDGHVDLVEIVRVVDGRRDLGGLF